MSTVKQVILISQSLVHQQFPKKTFICYYEMLRGKKNESIYEKTGTPGLRASHKVAPP